MSPNPPLSVWFYVCVRPAVFWCGGCKDCKDCKDGRTGVRRYFSGLAAVGYSLLAFSLLLYGFYRGRLVFSLLPLLPADLAADGAARARTHALTV